MLPLRTRLNEFAGQIRLAGGPEVPHLCSVMTIVTSFKPFEHIHCKCKEIEYEKLHFIFILFIFKHNGYYLFELTRGLLSRARRPVLAVATGVQIPQTKALTRPHEGPLQLRIVKTRKFITKNIDNWSKIIYILNILRKCPQKNISRRIQRKYII